MASNTFPQIRAAAINERCHNVFYRQTQLESLCKTLITNTTRISEAIGKDYSYSKAEIAIEINLTISCVRREYASLQPKQAHENEYLIAHGKDAAAARKPIEIIYIEPETRHTMFYSVVVPLSAAIAAGNCVVVLLEHNLRALPSVLRQLLTSALESDIFATATEPIKDQTLLDVCARVCQDSSDRWPRANQILSPAQSRTVAVVYRTADVQFAAKELVAARFSFNGQSPYAPDVVFVNEFAKREFLQAVVSECVKRGSGVSMNGDVKHIKSASSSNTVNDHIEALRKTDRDLRVILQEPAYAVVDLTSRSPDLISQKRNSPVLVVHAVRSLDDAIDTIASTKQDNGPTLAAYHFSNPASGKYLTQFIDANVIFVDHIPRQLLVGPAFPSGHPIDPAVRYPVNLFTVSKPAFINPSPSSQGLEAALVSNSNDTARRLMTEAAAPLTVMKRSPGGGVGFFEQGFLMNAGIILTTTISLTSSGAWWLIRNRNRLW